MKNSPHTTKPLWIYLFIALFLTSLLLDKAICSAICQFELYHIPLLKTFSFLGDYLALCVVFFALFCFGLYKRSSMAEELFDLLAAFGIGIMITYVLKVTIGKTRPFYLVEALEVTKYSFFSLSNHFHSFPSSHTVGCMTLFFYAKKRGWIYPPFLIFALGVCLSRLFLLKHHLSDIVAGAFIAYLIVNQFDKIKLFQKIKAKIISQFRYHSNG